MPNSSRSGVNDIYSQFQVQMIKGLQCATAEYQAIGVASAAKTYQNLRYDSADILCHSHHNAPISHHNIMFYQVYHTIFHKHNSLLCNTTGPHRAVQFACGSCLNIRWAADSYRLQCCLEGGWHAQLRELFRCVKFRGVSGPVICNSTTWWYPDPDMELRFRFCLLNPACVA